MPATRHHARVVWEGGKDDLRAHRIELGEQVLAGSSMPEVGGDAAKADPEGMLVAAVSSCHMLWFLDLARQARLRIETYVDAAEGEMDGVRFTGVTLRPRIGWRGEGPDAAALADLHHRAHEACYVANSVSFPVEVVPVEAAADA